MLKNMHPFDRRLPQISGRWFVELLCKRFECEVIHIRGSHFTLRRRTNSKLFVVPMHHRMNMRTLRIILNRAGITRIEFLEQFLQLPHKKDSGRIKPVPEGYGGENYWNP